jgi:hypothetical protein
MQKTCSNCEHTAQYSIVVIASSVGVSPRVQKSSPAVLFCDMCLRELCECLCSDDLNKAVNSAYTAIKKLSHEQSDAKNSNHS